MIQKPKLLLADRYINDAISQINKSTTRIHLLTMIIMYDESTERLFDAIIKAAKRGVRVEVVGDMFSYMERFGQFRPGMKIRGHLKPLTKLRYRLKKAGVKFTWLGDKASSIVTSRTHSKWLVIDDIVYSFGGVNLFSEGLENNDYMIKVKDIGLASSLIAEQSRIVKADRRGHAYRSHKIESGTNTILFDGGFIGESIIYNEACRLAKKSRRIIYVSQYCPSGKLGKLLKKTDTTFYFNPARTAAFLNIAVIKLASLLSGIKTIYNRPQYLHAKCMVFELNSGEKVALSGSHNFSNGGVWLGTREVCLRTTDHDIIGQLEKYIEQNIA